jgi:hypothetical protein
MKTARPDKGRAVISCHGHRLPSLFRKAILPQDD